MLLWLNRLQSVGWNLTVRVQEFIRCLGRDGWGVIEVGTRWQDENVFKRWSSGLCLSQETPPLLRLSLLPSFCPQASPSLSPTLSSSHELTPHPHPQLLDRPLCAVNHPIGPLVLPNGQSPGLPALKGKVRPRIPGLCPHPP